MAKLSDVVFLVVRDCVFTLIEAGCWISIFHLILFTIDNLLAEVLERHEHAIIAVPIILGPSVILSVEHVVLPLLVGYRRCSCLGHDVLGCHSATSYLP